MFKIFIIESIIYHCNSPAVPNYFYELDLALTEARLTQRKTILVFFCHFDARIQLLQKFSSLSSILATSLQKMACTLGLFSNYGSTFSEEVIIIRDPFSFSVKKHKTIL